jgi:hypothetical protein
MENVITRERVEVEKAALKIRNASDILMGLLSSVFEKTSDGVLNGKDRTEKMQQGFDWFNRYYDLLEATIIALHSDLEESAKSIDDYIMANTREVEDPTEATSADVLQDLYLIQSMAAAIMDYDLLSNEGKANVDRVALADAICKKAGELVSVLDK